MFGQYPRSAELISKMDRMRHVDCEWDCWATLAEAAPMLDDIADQLRRVHSGGQFALDVITAPDMNASQIWRCRRVNPRSDEVTARYKLGYGRALDQQLENVTETATVASARRCG
jgi:hypothetical protein